MRLVFKTVKTDRRSIGLSSYCYVCSGSGSGSGFEVQYFTDVVLPLIFSRILSRSIHLLRRGRVLRGASTFFYFHSVERSEIRMTDFFIYLRRRPSRTDWTWISGLTSQVRRWGKMERFPLSFTLKAFFKVGPNLLSSHCFTAIKFNKTSSAAGGQKGPESGPESGLDLVPACSRSKERLRLVLLTLS